MTATGHNELTAAIAENLKRRHSTHTEVVKEALPADVAQRLEALETALLGAAQALSTLQTVFAMHLMEYAVHHHNPDLPKQEPSGQKTIDVLQGLDLSAFQTLANRRAA